MIRLDFSRRADLTERMDEPDCCETMLFRTLDQFRLVNRAFSCYTTLLNRYVVQEMRKAPHREYCLIDVGAGGCDIARWLTRQARRYALRLRVLAVDGDPRVVRYARKANRNYPEIEIRMMDALELPVHEPVDFVFSNHLLHHLTDVQVVKLVKHLDGAGVHGYILSDIARSRLAWHSFRLAVTPFAHRSFIVSDGLTSIRRSFTVAELRQLLREAPLRNPVQVLSMFPSRLAIVGHGTFAARTDGGIGVTSQHLLVSFPDAQADTGKFPVGLPSALNAAHRVAHGGVGHAACFLPEFGLRQSAVLQAKPQSHIPAVITMTIPETLPWLALLGRNSLHHPPER